MTGLSARVIAKIFENERGVLIYERPNPRRKRHEKPGQDESSPGLFSAGLRRSWLAGLRYLQLGADLLGPLVQLDGFRIPAQLAKH